MRLAFSDASTSHGYATVFLNKQTQAIYASTDSGTTWQQVGTVQSPVGDFLSADPLDPNDVVMLSAYAPTVGQYTFQRSLDGGHTWTAQSTDLSTTGMVSQIGWSDSTLLVGFQLDDQLLGSSAVVAFPKGQPSFHLDANGKINGVAIPYLHALTGRHGKIVVWGNDGATPPQIIGVATTDGGNHWTSLPNTILGSPLTPVAATNGGDTIVATSADKKKVAVSSDGGETWTALPSFTSTAGASEGVFISAKGKKVIIARGDGTYAMHNVKWSRITSRQAVYVSEGGTRNAARLWSYDAQGHVIWLDD